MWWTLSDTSPPRLWTSPSKVPYRTVHRTLYLAVYGTALRDLRYLEPFAYFQCIDRCCRSGSSRILNFLFGTGSTFLTLYGTGTHTMGAISVTPTAIPLSIAADHFAYETRQKKIHNRDFRLNTYSSRIFDETVLRKSSTFCVESIKLFFLKSRIFSAQNPWRQIISSALHFRRVYKLDLQSF